MDSLKIGLEKEWDRAAVSHPFLVAVRSGTIDPAQFERWLVQDYLFVQQFVRFAGSVLSRAPNMSDVKLLLAGIGALTDEIEHFERALDERGLAFRDATPLKATEQYTTQLRVWATSLTWPELISVFWAIENVYNQAWSSCRDAHSPYKEWVERWANHAFSEYVAALDRTAKNALETLPQRSSSESSSSPAQLGNVQGLIRGVLLLEDAFWSMALE
ncbi:Bifunctional TENA-E protein [Porphyridium purpureum]|uniref:Bifunctional TENA-E protein n=1 Tax=Porphyridium purpureum TaxID=35688 RepID=A0A5J4Z166_PORPP|nr:Bifunctional TENA-E protein [Porphyridium purpureum]|eukprot:POR0570..scf208_2